MDVDGFFDHVRHSAAEVLNVLQTWGGPSIANWANLELFEKLRSGTAPQAAIRERDSTVTLCDLGQLELNLRSAGVAVPDVNV